LHLLPAAEGTNQLTQRTVWPSLPWFCESIDIRECSIACSFVNRSCLRQTSPDGLDAPGVPGQRPPLPIPSLQLETKRSRRHGVTATTHAIAHHDPEIQFGAMSTRPSLRSTSSGRPRPGTSASTAAPPPSALPRQHSIRTYFTPLSHNTSAQSHILSPKVEDAGSLAARKASRSHHNVARPSAETTDRDPPKPPPKTSVSHPPGAWPLTTNGVRPHSHLHLDDRTSEASSTPRPDSLNDAPSKSAGASSKETRTLRSKDGGSRLKSTLSIYFADYDDIITDAPKPPGNKNSTVRPPRSIALTVCRIFESH
jgi:hypothetical protein